VPAGLRHPRVIAGIACMAALLILPAASVAKRHPPPPGPGTDTVTAAGDNLILDDYGSVDIEVDAHSGPSGEDPGGHVSFVAGQILPISGPVTCLNVSGNTALMTVSPTGSFVELALVRVVDNGGSGLDRFEYIWAPPPMQISGDCHVDWPQLFGGPLIGRAVVSDVDPPRSFPTSKRQCKRGGYKRFGFKSKRLCIRYVKRHRHDGSRR